MTQPFSPDECHTAGWISVRERLARRLQYADFYDRPPERTDFVEALAFVKTYRDRYGYESPDCALESICVTIEAALSAPYRLRLTDQHAVKEIAPGNTNYAA